MRATRSFGLVRCWLPLVVAVAGGCGGDDDGPTQPAGPAVAEFLSRVATAEGATAAARTGAPPAGGNGPAASAELASATILGGTTQVTVTSTAAFTRVVVAVQGAQGYYEVTLPTATTEATMLLTLAQNLPENTFVIRYAVGTGAAVGAFDETPVAVTAVGTGDVQVSVSWDAASDVDLHVVDPAGDELYYGNPDVASGGELDLDSNPDCIIDNVQNENVTWPAGGAPAGEYVVRLDYYAGCNVPETNYVVTVRVKGRAPQTFSGKFTGAGDEGGEGSGIEITRFSAP
jgi:hypothetical protein